MTLDEVKEFIEERKQAGDTEEDIAKVFYAMYVDDTITLNDLEALIGAMGWEFTDEFRAMSDEDKKKDGLRTDDENLQEGVDKEDVEAAKEFGDDEDEKVEKKVEVKKEDEDEDDDKKAARLFGFGNK